MKRREFLYGLTSAATLIAAAGPALANTFADDVVGQLTGQGFTNVAVGTTWLGRIRITAEREGGTREIILNPRTGEILRDTWTAADGSVGTKPIVDNIADGSGGSHNSGGGGDGGNSGSSGSGDGGSGSSSGSGSGSGSGGGGGGDKGDKGDKGGGKDN